MDGGYSGDSDDQTQVEQLVSCFGGCKSHSTGITATSPEKKRSTWAHMFLKIVRDPYVW